METIVDTKPKAYNSELRALLSIRNFSKALERHYEQMLQIENSLDEMNNNALSTIETHSTVDLQEKWKTKLREVNNSMFLVNEILNLAKEKASKKDRSDSIELWKRFDLHLDNLKQSYIEVVNFGIEILPQSAHIHWKKDICNFESTVLPLIVTHAKACKVELQLIEKYTPQELDRITQIIFDHIPDDFTFAEADKYEKDYYRAINEFKKEFSEEKNLWDKFLDVLAGGTHQPPSERVMLERWIEGEKQDL